MHICIDCSVASLVFCVQSRILRSPVSTFYSSYVPGVFGNQQKRYLEVIKNMLQQSLGDTSSYKVGRRQLRGVTCAYMMRRLSKVVSFVVVR